MSPFPPLPIVTPDPPRKSQAEKYGGLLYLGLGGLACLLVLIGWFGYGLWEMKGVWADIYVLNDVRRAEVDRLNAAWRLARDPRVTQRQRWDLAISQTPPDLARYLLAETLTSEAAEADPRAYGLAVARSQGWPNWLRVLLARPMAYAAGEGGAVDREALEELARDPDPFVAGFAGFALDVGRPESGPKIPNEPNSSAFLDRLDRARSARQPIRDEALDEATALVRSSHPDAVRAWEGWEETSRGMVPKLPSTLP